MWAMLSAHRGYVNDELQGQPHINHQRIMAAYAMPLGKNHTSEN
jgi:hypothetical protein